MIKGILVLYNETELDALICLSIEYTLYNAMIKFIHVAFCFILSSVNVSANKSYLRIVGVFLS